MALQRVPIQTLADPTHRAVELQGNRNDKLPTDKVYVDPQSGHVQDGRRGDQLKDLRGNEMERPRTTWYGGW